MGKGKKVDFMKEFNAILFPPEEGEEVEKNDFSVLTDIMMEKANNLAEARKKYSDTSEFSEETKDVIKKSANVDGLLEGLAKCDDNLAVDLANMLKKLKVTDIKKAQESIKLFTQEKQKNDKEAKSQYIDALHEIRSKIREANKLFPKEMKGSRLPLY